MSGENMEVWDDDFLEELNQVEQLALSSSSTAFFSQPPPLISSAMNNNNNNNSNPIISYSPPRNLSQRTTAAAAASAVEAKDLEIQRLKRELGLVSKQLSEMEHECLELKKDKKEKEKLIANIHHSKCQKVKNGVPAVDHHEVFQQFQKAKDSDQVGNQINSASSSCKAIGIQVDQASHSDHLQKLRAIWGSPGDQELGKTMISKLFVDCSQEFHALFGCMNMNTSSIMKVSLPVKSSVGASKYHHADTDPSSEAANISHLYSVLTKVVVVSNSLRVLKVFLKHLLTLKNKAGERENVMVEGVLSRDNVRDLHGSYTAENRLFYLRRDEASSSGCNPFGTRFSDAETLHKKGIWSPVMATSLSRVNWVSLFELMHQTTMRVTDEHVRSEAISIMNMILMSSYSYMEREKFGQKLVFENISQLLNKEAGVQVQKEAVHLLYLLLNCPKIFCRFCSGYKEENAGVADDSHVNLSPSILESLADCIGCCGTSVQDLELRRNAIILLALIVSYGRPGVEILVSQKLPREANFLMLILQVLVAEIDTESSAYTVPADLFRARTLLIRETLILLNRLVSNPSYSSIVLQVLTSSRDMASLTVDVATRLSRKEERRGQSDSISRQMRESEILDLGRKFKKRVFAYLGDSIS
ncbi:protein SENSITIVE TO UV 2 isoform X3 [Citrus sinensis]|uniref:protein SENSITIVE TO UV 2 isoform X3 n=1 Tax=Citrus sinensis TaxID=2711 RepID=UPI002277A5CB|nr:protein SENSITIVE TO UV 2 isoform X3 [Citrus sinensis]